MRKLRALSRENPTASDFEALTEEIYFGSSDRAAALMLGSIVEVALQELCKKAFVSELSGTAVDYLFGPRGPFNSFSAKAEFTCAMRLIGATTNKDLTIVRHIRNAFAHSRLPLKFGDPTIAKACIELRLVDVQDALYDSYGYMAFIPSSGKLAESYDRDDPRTRFFTTCSVLHHRIIMKALGPVAGDWALDDPTP